MAIFEKILIISYIVFPDKYKIYDRPFEFSQNKVKIRRQLTETPSILVKEVNMIQDNNNRNEGKICHFCQKGLCTYQIQAYNTIRIK